MSDFLFKDATNILVDPSLISVCNLSNFEIVFSKLDEINYTFILSNNKKGENELIVDKEFFSEKACLIKNYKTWVDAGVFDANTPTRALLDCILIESLINNASDIHFDCVENEKYVVRFKVNCVLKNVFYLTRHQFNSVSVCLKILCKIDSCKVNTPQSSSFIKVFKNNVVDFRVSTHPTIYSERFVIRVLQKKNIINLNCLDLDEKIEQIVKKTIIEPSGLVIVSGPTNSGKTTFVHSILKEIVKQNVVVMTLEDPVEYKISGVVQTSVNESFTYYDGLKSVLRQDPNVVFIGEIRDKETACLAVQAALAGHKIIATIHSCSLRGVVYRLLDFGVSYKSLSECLMCVFSQRLYRCFDGVNYAGLNLLIDGVFVDENIKQQLLSGNIPDFGSSLKSMGKKIVDKGITDTKEIERVLGLLN